MDAQAKERLATLLDSIELSERIMYRAPLSHQSYMERNFIEDLKPLLDALTDEFETERRDLKYLISSIQRMRDRKEKMDFYDAIHRSGGIIRDIRTRIERT